MQTRNLEREGEAGARVGALGFALGVLLVVGCGAKSLVVNEVASPPVDPESPPAPDKSKICVIRPAPTEGSTVHAVRDNGALMGGTRGSSHFCYLAEPGEHTVRIEIAEPVNINAKGGRLFYLHEEVTEVMGTIVEKLSWMEEPEAKSLLSSTKYVVLVSAAGETIATVAPKK